METTSGKLLPSRQNMFPMSAECFFIHHSQLHKALRTANNCSDQSRLSLRAEVGSRSERPGPPERTGRAPIGSTSDPTWVRHWAPSRSERERRHPLTAPAGNPSRYSAPNLADAPAEVDGRSRVVLAQCWLGSSSVESAGE